jgi:hypothetical protein
MFVSFRLRDTRRSCETMKRQALASRSAFLALVSEHPARSAISLWLKRQSPPFSTSRPTTFKTACPVRPNILAM